MTIDGIGGRMNVKLHRKEWRYNNDGHDVFTGETEFRKRMREQHHDWTELNLCNGQLFMKDPWRGPLVPASSASPKIPAHCRPFNFEGIWHGIWKPWLFVSLIEST